MIPLATTTISVLRAPAGDDYAEPYGGDDPGTWAPSAENIRAVIDRPSGREQIAGGEQSIWDFELVCDPCDLDRLDQVKDDTTDIVYRVVWVMTYADDHTEAGLRLVQGDI